MGQRRRLARPRRRTRLAARSPDFARQRAAAPRPDGGVHGVQRLGRGGVLVAVAVRLRKRAVPCFEAAAGAAARASFLFFTAVISMEKRDFNRAQKPHLVFLP